MHGLSLKKRIEIAPLLLPFFCTQSFYLVVNMTCLCESLFGVACHISIKKFQYSLEISVFNVRKNI